MPEFSPIQRVDGYLPIEDHALIGSGTASALVARDGSIPWMCVPRFDSYPLFAGMLDCRRGGSFAISLDGLVESSQYYVDGTGVLVTELRSSTGRVRITDAMTLRSGVDLSEDAPPGRREVIRWVEVLRGPVTLRVDIDPYGGAVAERASGGYEINCTKFPDLDLHLACTIELDGLHSELHLDEGDQFHIMFQWNRSPRRYAPVSPDRIMQGTIDSWRHWVHCVSYDGPQYELVRRSAITLKLMDFLPNGAIVAAPTSSLPESIGGVRNWDYRYAWIRDAAFSVYALRRIGLSSEAWAFLGWVLDVIERDGHPCVLYTLDGEHQIGEWEDPDLEGYRKSSPVRWGNGAANQRQHDVYGEILDCAYQWAMPGGSVDEHLWKRLVDLIEGAASEWHEPDHGIWEVRTAGHVYTYSAAMCQVALDRGARMAEHFGLDGDIARWRRVAGTIRQGILEEAWNPEIPSFTEHLGGGGLDASLLTLPLRRVIPADHPKMIATTKAVMDRLGAGNGLMYRYLPEESPDGVGGDEGAFLLCSFWYVDNLAKYGRIEEALDLYNSLCSRANSAGLLPEQIDPSTGKFLGNFPQAFSHVGVISSGVNLAREMNRVRA